MTPEQMQAKAVSALAEEFDHRHEDPALDAQRWIGRLMASGWRPMPSLLDRPGPAPRANAETAKRWVRQIRAERGWPEPDGGAA